MIVSRRSIAAGLVGLFASSASVARSVQTLWPDPAAVEWRPDVAGPARHREFSVSMALPRRRGAHPVVIYSHSGGGAGSIKPFLPLSWAAAGFVCIAPTHADTTWIDPNAPRLSARSDVGLTTGSEVRLTTAPSGERGLPFYLDRVADVTRLLDALTLQEDWAAPLRDRVDTQRIAMAGHSLGAYTAQLMSGVTVVDPSGVTHRFRDPRIGSVIILSGQGPGVQGLTEASWDEVDLPLLNVTGSLDRGAQGQDPAWKQQPFDRAPARASSLYDLYLPGAHHSALTGPLVSPGFQPGGRRRAIVPEARLPDSVPADAAARTVAAVSSLFLRATVASDRGAADVLNDPATLDAYLVSRGGAPARLRRKGGQQ